jgi:hypothetical protein
VQDNENGDAGVTDPMNRNKNKTSLFKTFQDEEIEIDIPSTGYA